MIEDFRAEFARYRALGERAMAQMTDDALNHVPAPDANSAAMIVRHMGGNLVSRFTDFLTTDGEKPWRDRDAEFETRRYPRDEVDAWWQRGWGVLEAQLAALADADLARTVTIRGEPYTVHGALTRAVAHAAHHVGQLVLLARATGEAPWRSLSIPRGGSAAFTAALQDVRR